MIVPEYGLSGPTIMLQCYSQPNCRMALAWPSKILPMGNLTSRKIQLRGKFNFVKNLTSRESLLPEKNWLLGGFEIPGNLNSREIWIPRKSYFSGNLDSREILLSRKLDFTGNVTSRNIQVLDKTGTFHTLLKMAMITLKSRSKWNLNLLRPNMVMFMPAALRSCNSFYMPLLLSPYAMMPRGWERVAAEHVA